MRFGINNINFQSLVILILLLFSACTYHDESADNQPEVSKSNDGFAIPAAIRAAQLPADGKLVASIYMDGKFKEEKDVTGASSVRFELGNIPAGRHTFSIRFDFTNSTYGTVQLAYSIEKSVNVTSGGSQNINFKDDNEQNTDFTFPDKDGDGSSNLVELNHGSDPGDSLSRPILGSANTKINTVVTSASHSSPLLSFNEDGDGMAVWEVNTGTGRKLLYSYYTAITAQWSMEQLLAAQPGSSIALAPQLTTNGSAFAVVWKQLSDDASITNVNARIYANSAWRETKTLISYEGSFYDAVKISSNGTGFAVVWRQQDTARNQYRIYAKIYASVAVDSWGGAAPLDDTNITSDVSYGSYTIASNGSGYAAIWVQNNNSGTDAFANVYDGTAWLGTAMVLNDTIAGGVNAQSSPPTLASNGSGYQFVWWQYDGTAQRIYTKGFHSATWSTTVAVKSNTDSVYFKPTVASNGTNYAIGWTQQTTGIFANVGIGSTWEGEQRVDLTNLSNAWQPTVASNGDGYIMVWSQNAVGGERNVYASRYVATKGWSSAAQLDLAGEAGTAGTPQISSNGATYAAVWTQADNSGSFNNIWASVYDSGWTTAATIEEASANASSPNVAVNGSQYAFSWEQDSNDLSSLVAMRFYSNQFDSINYLITLQHNGSVRNQQLLANNNGRTLATWQQFHNGNWRLYASIYQDGIWSTPERLSDSVFLDNHNATDGNGFLIAWYESQAGQNQSVRARLYTQTGWEVPKDFVIQTEYWDMRVASNGIGYTVVWIDGFAFYAAIFNGAVWTNAENLGGVSTGPFGLASNGSGYAFAWNEAEILSSIYTGAGGWDAQIPVQGTAPPQGANPIITSNSNQYAIVYQQDDGGTTNLYASLYTGSAWGTSVNLDLSALTSTPELFQLATNQSGYAVVWRQSEASNSNLYANVYGTVWQADAVNIESLPGATGTPTMVSNGSGYLVAWRQQDGAAGTPYSAYANVYNGTDWLTDAQLLESSSDTVTSELTAQSNGSTYAIAWLQKAGDVNDLNVARYENGSWLYPIVVDETDGAVFDPVLTNDGTSYSMGWLQINPATDPVTVEFWSRMNF